MAALSSLRRLAESYAARVVIFTCYAFALLVCRLCTWKHHAHRPPSGRIVVTGTFHNAGWYLSHATPLARAGLREVIVISTGDLPAVPGVRCFSPPRWLVALAGRTLAKLVWTIRAGVRFDADLFMGYHIIPNSTTALIAARLLGRRACYQMTGGPVEIMGGGYTATENPFLGRLRRPSAVLERLALQVTREFDLVVVRGRSARHFVTSRSRARNVVVIPGSVDLGRFPPASLRRSVDLIFVGRLAATKQPLQFVEIVAAVRRRLPGVRAAIVGDGPMADDVRKRVLSLNLTGTIALHGQIADVSPYVADARVFVLTSRSEGLSIAMAEAMISGTVPVVAHVGDLADLIVDGENGFLVQPNDIEQYAERIAVLLTDPDRWQRLSAAGERAARDYNGVDRVAALWNQQITALTPSLAARPAASEWSL